MSVRSPNSAKGTFSDDKHWSESMTDLIVDTVDMVRDRTVLPVTQMVRAVAYAVVIVLLAIPVIMLLLVLTIRFLDVVIPESVFIPYLILGTVFCIAGLVLWSKRK